MINHYTTRIVEFTDGIEPPVPDSESGVLPLHYANLDVYMASMGVQVCAQVANQSTLWGVGSYALSCCKLPKKSGTTR